METVAFCEVDPFCRAVLKKHWPGVKIYGELDLICGLSLSDIERGREANGDTKPRLRPDWVVIENSGHTWRRWVPELRRSLHDLGYASVPIRVRADWLGYPHRRSRVFIVANADSESLRKFAGWWCRESWKVAKELARPEDYVPQRLGKDDGVPGGVDRRRSLGNAVIPQIPEIIGRAILESEKTMVPVSAAV